MVVCKYWACCKQFHNRQIVAPYTATAGTCLVGELASVALSILLLLCMLRNIHLVAEEAHLKISEKKYTLF